ncbi:MAG: hypothetical protein Q4F58_03135 [Candidatus Saccharibacteria bacterium]|nr:hypothetical protein [Candidatus Saccharibacteria bacterium]
MSKEIPAKTGIFCYNKYMVMVRMLSWWYVSGWGIFIKKLGERFSNLADFFSMSSLLRTLFQPYRQISADTAANGSSLETKFHAFTDRLVSRCVGFVTRLFLLIIGVIVMILTGVVGLAMVVAWPLIPFLPVAGIVATCMGVLI